jgi:DNA (cytosine-5)-methyltransferase 1
MAVVEYIRNAVDSDKVTAPIHGDLPTDKEAAIALLENFVEGLFLRPINELEKNEFMRAWWSVGFLHPNLHPDAASDNGKGVSRGPKRGVSFVVEPIYVQSGWPVELIPIAQEARRRFDAGLLAEDEYYCSAAVIAGAFSHGR